MVFFYYVPLPAHRWLCAVVFALAALTDWLDGYIARQYQQSSVFGAFLDPVADKLIVSAALLLLVAEYPHFYMTIPSLIIVGREITISALREWMAEMGKRTSVAVSFIGKIKTSLQMAALFALLAHQPHTLFVTHGGFNTFLLWAGFLGLYSATVLTLWSMMVYLRAAWPDLIGEA
jgi:CDP-diacylglycerol--glycerol-3-phosphate 3-phosphatidyltransferase